MSGGGVGISGETAVGDGGGFVYRRIEGGGEEAELGRGDCTNCRGGSEAKHGECVFNRLQKLCVVLNEELK